jgi:diguanylate cyclase (GGDEF)-like protein
MAEREGKREAPWVTYFRNSRQNLTELERLLGGLMADPGRKDDFETVERIFHNFSGSGKLFGAPKVSELGGEGEFLCYGATMADRAPTRNELQQIGALARKLRQAFQALAESDSTSGNPASADFRTVPLVLIVDTPSAPRSGLSDYFAKRGLQVKTADHLAGADRFLAKTFPDMVAVASDLPDGPGQSLVRKIREMETERSIPIILLGSSHRFLDRVEAISCGADGFVNNPPDPATLFRKFKGLLGRRKASNGRILAVEDDPSQARFIESTLEGAGYLARVISDPERFETEIHTFRPDLVLIDVLLPKVSGFDLVRFLRQEEGFSAIPVVYLTTETRSQAQIEGIEAGGDDYLVKPVSSSELLGTIRSRLIRYQNLRAMMDHDELTALLAHTPFLQQARLCLSRYSRHQVPYALVLLKVYPANEEVERSPKNRNLLIQSLAKFLQRRVRQTDVMGRFAEDLVALVLEHLTEEDARMLLNKLQAEFSTLEHSVDPGRGVRGAFAAGAAMAGPGIKTLKDWLDLADDALKEALEAGGPGVVMVRPPG